MAKELKRTPAQAWRTKPQLVELPSGNVAELRRLNLIAMMKKQADVPNFLLVKVQEGISGKRKTKLLSEEAPEVDAKDALESLLWIARECFVYPKLVDGEAQGDDEACIDDIGLNDLMFVMDYAIGDIRTVQTVERFRPDENGNVEPVPASANVVE